MIELIKFELRKIFSNKLVAITAVLIALFIVGTSTINIMKIENKLGTRKEVESIAEGYINGEYSNREIKNLINEIREKRSNGEELSKEEEFLWSCSLSFSIADKNEKEAQIEKIDGEIDELKENNKEDTFKYNKLLKEKEMMESLPEKESIFCGDWFGVLDFNVEGTMKIILLAVGLAGIFSKEYSNRVSYINLSTKNGKTKMNTAKLIAAFIYTTVVFIFVTILFAITTFYLGLPNGDKPISYIMNSIYNISINKYFLYTLAFSYFGTLIFAMFIVLISLLTKNIILEFGIPILIYFIPCLFRIPDFIEGINFTNLFRGEDILGNYKVIDIFGNAVLYPYVITVTGIIEIIVMILIYKRLGKNQTIV